jgi:hypothetical protein
MVTNIKLKFGFGNGLVKFTINDHYKTVAIVSGSNESIMIKEKIEIPNTLEFNISHCENSYLKILQIWLGGVEIPGWFLNQICNFYVDNDKSITTYWNKPGLVKLEFFSPDFIQYHLIYGNKQLKEI